MAIATGLEDRPWYFGLGIGLVVAIAMVFALDYLVIKDLKVEIAGLDAELGELAKKIEAGRAAEKKLPQFREEVARLELELEKLRRILPSARNTEEIIKKIKSLVDQGDFRLASLNFNKINLTDSTEVYVEWPITVQISGTYHNLAILFNRLGNFSRIVNVESCTIDAVTARPDETITTTFVAKTFVYVEPKDLPEAVTPAPGGPKTPAPGGPETESEQSE